MPTRFPRTRKTFDYESMLAAYSAEQQMLQDVAARFVAGSAGNGAHNLKDLLVDLTLSDHFRADSVDAITSVQEAELDQIGTGKLLTPEQLNRKLESPRAFVGTTAASVRSNKSIALSTAASIPLVLPSEPPI